MTSYEDEQARVVAWAKEPGIREMLMEDGVNVEVDPDHSLFIPDARSLLAEARAGLRAADHCDMNQGSARLCGACAAMLVYPLRLLIRAADGDDPGPPR